MLFVVVFIIHFLFFLYCFLSLTFKKDIIDKVNKQIVITIPSTVTPLIKKCTGESAVAIIQNTDIAICSPFLFTKHETTQRINIIQVISAVINGVKSAYPNAISLK